MSNLPELSPCPECGADVSCHDSELNPELELIIKCDNFNCVYEIKATLSPKLNPKINGFKKMIFMSHNELCKLKDD